VITSSGLYIVTVAESNNPTYLRGGLYDVVVSKHRGTEVCFRSVVSGAGTFERKAMLDIFEKQGRVVCTPVSPETVRFAETLR
jgi:hypothetical protein